MKKQLLLIPCALVVLTSCGGSNNPEENNKRIDYSIAELDTYLNLPKSLSHLMPEVGQQLLNLTDFEQTTGVCARGFKYTEATSCDIRSANTDLYYPPLLTSGNTIIQSTEATYYSDNVVVTSKQESEQTNSIDLPIVKDYESHHDQLNYIEDLDGGNYRIWNINDSTPSESHYGSVTYKTPGHLYEEKSDAISYIQEGFGNKISDATQNQEDYLSEYYFFADIDMGELSFYIAPDDSVYACSINQDEGRTYYSQQADPELSTIASMDYYTTVIKMSEKDIDGEKVWVRDYMAKSWKEMINRGDDGKSFDKAKCIRSEYSIIEYKFDRKEYGEISTSGIGTYTSPFSVGIDLYSRDIETPGHEDFYYQNPYDEYFIYSDFIQDGGGVFDETPLAIKLGMINEGEHLYYGYFSLRDTYTFVSSTSVTSTFRTGDYSFVIGKVNESLTALDTVYGYDEIDFETYCSDAFKAEDREQTKFTDITPIIRTATDKVNAVVGGGVKYLAYLHFDANEKLITTDSYVCPYRLGNK